jgi:hypothetical protein
VVLHLAVTVALPLCAIAAWWQVDRALAGNTLSWMYVFEWPAFSGIAVWCWWVLLHGPHRGAGPPRRAGSDPLDRRRAPIRWDRSAESERLRAYNSYLADLNAGRAPAGPSQEARQ